MDELKIHSDIIDKLDLFHKSGKIPNIIFHGPTASGKKYLLYKFIDMIYNNDKGLINKYVISANCTQGKGIKFIREELKFFARINMDNMDGHTFKTIILQNADKLTTDAQSALRRCIELCSHTTRFFIVVEDKFKLLKPILSRFCEIYVSLPIINKKELNLYEYFFKTNYKVEPKTRLTKLRTLIFSKKDNNNMISLSNSLYNKGFSGIDIIQMIEKSNSDEINMSISNKYKLLIHFQQIKKEFRYEPLFILSLLQIIRFDVNLENVVNM